MAVALALLVLLACTACSGGTASSSGAAASGAPATISNTATRTVTDPAGNTLTLPAEVHTIVSLAAATTRILADLGLADKLVAVDSYSVPNLGDGAPADLPVLDMMAPDLELLASLSPDIIFTSDLSSAGGADIFHPLREAGATVVEIPAPKTVAGVLDDVRFVGRCVNEEAAANALADTAQQTLDHITALLAGVAERPSVYFEVSPAPYLYSTGGGTYLNELIALAGGANVLAAEDGWISVNEEAVLAAKPEAIFTVTDYLDDPTGEIAARPGWDTLPAVQNGQVFTVNTRNSQQPTQHVVDAVVELLHHLHPALAQQLADGQDAPAGAPTAAASSTDPYPASNTAAGAA